MNLKYKNEIFLDSKIITLDITNIYSYYYCMIKDFKDSETEKIWKGTRSLKLPHEIQEIARRKLRMLNNAQDINDLMIPPSNRLEKLKGDKKDLYSIRINQQWRICFRWNTNAFEVEIIDYH